MELLKEFLTKTANKSYNYIHLQKVTNFNKNCVQKFEKIVMNLNNMVKMFKFDKQNLSII